MATVNAGDPAPAMAATLDDAEGVAHRLDDALAAGPVLLGIYKSSCQASKTMFPFLERLHQRYASHGLTVYGVSQDSANVSRSFARRVGITFPILIDDDDYAVSRAFEVTATPTVFLMQPDGSVAHMTMGFFKDSVNELAGAVATAVGQPAEPVFTDADTDVPRFVPG